MAKKTKKISSIKNPRMAKRKSKIASKNLKMKNAHAASKATGKPVMHYLKLYDYFK